MNFDKIDCKIDYGFVIGYLLLCNLWISMGEEYACTNLIDGDEFFWGLFLTNFFVRLIFTGNLSHNSSK